MSGCDCREGPVNVVEDRRSGDAICMGCGVVVEAHMFDDRPAYDTFAPSGRNDAFVPPIPHSQRTAANAAAPRGRDFSRVGRERDAHRSAREGLAIVERFGRLMNATETHQIVEMAKRVYVDYAAAAAIRHDAREAFAAAALYFGCKAHARACDRGARSLREIAALCGIPDLHGAVNAIKATLRDVDYRELLLTAVGPSDMLLRTLQRVTDVAELTPDEWRRVQRRAFDVCDVITESGVLEGRFPSTVCAVVIFRACDAEIPGKKVRKSTIYTACEITSVTMNKALAMTAELF